jgi:formate/nitrite transporter
MKAFLGLSLLVVGAAALKAAPAPALRLRGGMDKTPPEAYQAFVATGVRQATMPTLPTVLQALLAGGFVALGAALAMTVGANLPGIKSTNPGLQKIILGAFGLPWALMLVLLTGGQLFTGNTATITTALLEGQVTLDQMLKNFFLSYFGNFAGGLIVISLLAAAGLTAPGAAAVATAKTSLPFVQALIRGFLCNWMVCIAVWQAYCANTVAGKYTAVFFTISSFVALGFEHSVANMAMIPLGMLNGADISVAKFLTSNLIPVTIGNMLSGILLVGTAYYFSHGSGKKFIS